MAREGRIAVWAGMWLSSAILLPMGVFFTYKAVHDSALFNLDAYRNFFRRLVGINETRHYDVKEVVMDDVIISEAIKMSEVLSMKCAHFVEKYKRKQSYIKYWLAGFERKDVDELYDLLEAFATYLSNSKSQLVINKISQFPMLKRYWAYQPSSNRLMSWGGIVLFPIGLPIYLVGLKCQTSLMRDIKSVMKINADVIEMLKNER